jgi:SAM-dependent methyltransferase
MSKKFVKDQSSMNSQTVQALIQINQVFYDAYGAPFAATRQRIQPGIRQLMRDISMRGDWLDLGCGNGSVLTAWAETASTGSYTGLDFSQVLLKEAELRAIEIKKAGKEVWLQCANISDGEWGSVLSTLSKKADGFPEKFDGVMSFATIHHIPGFYNRLVFFQQAHQWLKPEGIVLLSCWQFQNSPKLVSRIQPWSMAAIDPDQLEPGDTLLDWRAIAPGQNQKAGLRYVHLLSREELAKLAEESGFEVIQTFESDGEGGRLGLYQVWKAA